MDNLTNQSLPEFISGFPQGVSAGEIERQFKVPRTSLNRRLKDLVGTSQLIVTGKGPATRYHSADSLSSLRAYFAKPHTERTQAPYDEARLAPQPALSAETEQKFSRLK